MKVINAFISMLFAKTDKSYVPQRIQFYIAAGSVGLALIFILLGSRGISLLWLAFGFCLYAFIDIMLNLKVNPPQKMGKKIHAVISACAMMIFLMMLFFMLVYYIRAFFL